ncbi:hypothetical protein, partial [[Mycoplasma] collis]|uniref:hypothetical protein n=1 Tax=[Mycoplasma] collis TaxID=2127 RepID=UPI00051BF7C3
WYNTHTFDTGEFAKNIFDKVWKINNESDLDYWIDELDVKFTNSENWFVPGEVSVPYFPYDEPVNTFNNQYFVNTPSILKNIKADLRNKIKAQYNKIAKAIKEEQSIITKFNIENLKINVNFHMVNKQEHYFLSKIDKFKINISFDFKYEFKHISNAIENFHNKIKDKLNSEFIDLDSFKTIDIKNPFETDLFSSENLNNSNIKSLINTKNNIIINYLKNEYQKHELSKLINLNFKITENNKEKQYDIEYSYYYKNQTVPKILGSIKYQGDNTKYKNQLTTEAKKRLKFTSGVYIDKSDRNKYKIEEFETPEEKNNISYFNTFPIVEFVSSTTKNEVLFINDEPVPAFDNVFRLELKDNKIDKKNQSIWNKYLQAQENYLSNRNTNNKTAFENAKKNWDKLNTYKIEVKEFDSENKKFTTTYTKTIVINSQLDEFIEIKFYAWDPNKFPEQKEIINEYLKDSDDKFILNDNNEKIPNFKYNKFVNPKTGTNPEIIVLDYYNNVE